MKLLDANILLYAYNADSEHHEACRPWLEQVINGSETVALPWQTLLAFIRISTNPKAMAAPLRAEQACELVDQLLAHPNVSVVNAGASFWDLFKGLIREARVSGPLVTDAALAGLAQECGATLCTTDRDFRRFGNLRLLDPTDKRNSV